jgi:hypothetical protein
LLNGRAQIKLAADALAQCAHTPALDAAHLGVELTFQRLFERQDFDEMAPAQFSRQRYDNVLVRNASANCTMRARLRALKPLP